MAIASLVISVVSLLVAGFGALLAYRSLAQAKRSADAADRSAEAGERSATAAERSATTSDRSADAAQRSAIAAEGSRDAAAAQAEATAIQAATARDQLAIDRERFHQEQTPILEGSVKLRPAWLGGPEDKDHILEVRVRGNRTLSTLLLHLPLGTYIGRTRTLSGPSGQVFSYPEVGRSPIGPGNPAIWNIAVGAESPGLFTARADCRDEDGHQWLDVEVPITRES